jgi:hypothetical protein
MRKKTFAINVTGRIPCNRQQTRTVKSHVPQHVCKSNKIVSHTEMDDEWYYACIDREIGSKSAETKKWVLAGLCMSYSFNHDEAVQCYKRAIEAVCNERTECWMCVADVSPCKEFSSLFVCLMKSMFIFLSQ